MGLFDIFKTAIFPGINDQPRPATAELASNPSDLINKINGLIDKLNLLISPKWGDSILYLDGINGSDSNSGYSASTAVKTFAVLKAIIAEKVIDGELTIYVSNTNFNFLDLNNLKVQTNGSIVFDRYIGFFTFEPEYQDGNEVLKNFPYNLKITIKNAIFNCYDGFTFSSLENLTLSWCEFNSYFGYGGTLLKLSDLKNSKITGGYFRGDSNGYTNNNLLRIENSKNIELESTYSYYSTGDSLAIDYSTVTLTGYNSNSRDYLETDKKSIALQTSSLFIEGNQDIYPWDVAINNSNVTDNSNNNSNLKIRTWTYPNLSDEIVVLIPSTAKNCQVKSMILSAESGTATCDLLLNNQNLVNTSSSNLSQEYDLNLSTNKLSQDSGDDLKLQITGSLSKIVVQIAFVEF